MNAIRVLSSLAAGMGLLMYLGIAEASPYPLDEILKKEPAEKLAKADIKTTDELLAKGALPKDLRVLAKTTDIPYGELSVWVKQCDLLRLKSVGMEMVRLLNAGKIMTIKQLKTQNAGKLHKKLMEANQKVKITEKPPAEEQIDYWIEQAKKLPIILR